MLACRVVVAFLWALTLGIAHAAELKLSTAVGPAFPIGKAGAVWAKLLTERTHGAFDVRPHPGATLAARDPLREWGALRDGAADLAVGSALAWSAQLPAFAAYGLPWIAVDAKRYETLASDGSVRELVASAAAKAGVVVVAIVPLGERVLATVKAAATTPAEIAGLRLRTQPVPIVTDTLAALGTRPESMSFADAQAAIAAGTLGGQEATASTLAATRVAASGLRFVSRWGAFGDAMVFAVRQELWSQWSAQQQAAVKDAALEAAREADAAAREDAALAELGRQGMTIVTPTPAQRAAFRAAAEPVWAKWTTVIGAEIVAAARAAAER